MDDLNLEWENYFNDVEQNEVDIEKKDNTDFVPKCSDIYISCELKLEL